MQPKLSFETVGIISRPRGSNLATVLPPLVEWLTARGIRTVWDEETAAALNSPAKGNPRSQVADDSQILLVLGGDGTLLAAAREAAPRGIPILPINMGSLGFLTSFTVQELYPALTDTLAGHFAVSERAMLRSELVRDGKVAEAQNVLNEVVINKGELARMIDVELFIDQGFVCRYKSDGLIAATPTGSTAYSLSAGGPIVHPTVESMIITPICPHTLSDRPVVVRDSSLIEMRLSGHSDSVFLTLDGQKGIALQAADLVRVYRAQQRLKLIQPPKKSYFEILHDKLKWGET